MKNTSLLKSNTFLALLFALGSLTTFNAKAQNAEFNLCEKGPRTEGDITLDYKWYVNGANIESRYSLNITSAEKNISRVEFEGVYNSTRNLGIVIVDNDNGTLEFNPNGTSVWQGSTRTLSFKGQSDTDYCISTLRIWYGIESCNLPTISGGGCNINFSHDLPDAVIHYTIAPNGTNNSGLSTTGRVALNNFAITAKAEAENHAPSGQVNATLTLSSVKGKTGDVDANGDVNMFDMEALIHQILNRK